MNKRIVDLRTKSAIGLQLLCLEKSGPDFACRCTAALPLSSVWRAPPPKDLYHKKLSNSPMTQKKTRTVIDPDLKLGYKDSNLEMTESESVALPFGDSPMSRDFYII